MAAALFFDAHKHVALFIEESKTKVDYVQHIGKAVNLLSMDKAKFYREFTPGESKRSMGDLAKNLLGLSKTGVAITPAARFALEQVMCKQSTFSTPTTPKEAPMAVPTSISKTKKEAAPTKKEVAPKAVVKAPKKDAPAKLSEMEATPSKVAQEAVSEMEATPSKVAQEAVSDIVADAKAEAVSDIVADAKAEAERLVSEARAALDEAKKKAEEKKATESAKAQAAKILAAAKAEVEKIKKAIKDLSGKKGVRAHKGEGEEKAPRATRGSYEDISEMKIVQVNEPKVREGSVRGALALAVFECSTVAEALEYEGVNQGFIRKMVANGFIELA